MSKRIEWADYVWRPNEILKKVLVEKIKGKISRRRPRQRWTGKINKNINKCSRNKTITDNMDKIRWRNIVEAVKMFR